MHKTIALSYTDSTLREKAERLAESLDIELVDVNQKQYAFVLLLTPQYLGIYQPEYKQLKPYYIDFETPKLLYRIQHSSPRTELLVKAIGFKPIQSPVIIDATAGLGRDSFMLASLRYRVIMLERSPIIASMLQDAMHRASQNSSLAAIIERLVLVKTNAIEWLQQLSSKPNVVYLDPMFPPRRKSAKVKKEMSVLQDLLHESDADPSELFMTALACASNRVVVKRPRIAEFINKQKPNYSLTGKSSRFDIYLVG